MQQSKTKTVTITMLLLLIFACQNNNGQKYSFEYNFEKDTIFKRNIRTETKISRKMFGEEMTNNMIIHRLMSYKIKDNDDDIYSIDMKLDTFKIDFDVLGIKNSYNFYDLIGTADEEDLYDKSETKYISKLLMNVPVEFTMDKRGRIKTVNIDEIFNFINATDELNSTKKQFICQQFEKIFSIENIKNYMEKPELTYMPQNPVAVGDKWNLNNSEELPTAFFAKNANIKLKKVINNIALLEIKGNIEIEDYDDIAIGLTLTIFDNNSTHKTILKGKEKATVEIDANTGWIIKADIVQELEGYTEVNNMKYPTTAVKTIKIRNE
ncbi:MAG: DUF6263 family protein [Prevotellaceae bacterium]|jgi:hypothetical protein|nr:DUF6263 family protein [Prevotellaceae bacterium]